MLTLLGRPSRACDGITRRRLLEVAGAGLLGTSFAKLAAAAPRPAGHRTRARSVIFLFLFGGPSQLETFDMKPEAPDAIRGPFRPIDSRTPGLRICEHLPRTAAVSDKFCVVRTMTHPYNDHSGGGHYIQTGHPWSIPIGAGFNATPSDWPSMGSIAQYTQPKQSSPRSALRGRAAEMPGDVPCRAEMPGYVVVPNSLGRLQEGLVLRRPGEYAGWLGSAYEPLTTAIDKRSTTDNPYWRDCTDDGLHFQIQGLAGGGGGGLERRGRRR